MVTMGFFARIESNNRYFDRAAARGIEFPQVVDTTAAFQAFTRHLLPTGAVVGLGSGDGRGLAAFASAGREVFGVEPSAARRRAANERGVFTIEGAFENLGSRALPAVAGVWCGAALHHVPADYFGRVIANIAAILPACAPVFFALEIGEGTDWLQLDPGVMDAESLVQRYDVEDVDRVMSQQALDVVDRRRAGSWLSLVALKA